MTSESMSDSSLSQLRQYSMARASIPYSAQAHRVSKCSFENEHPTPVIDRNDYKLRMKSDLNVEIVNATCRHRQQTATTKNLRHHQHHLRSAKTAPIPNEQQFHGIEGNAVRVGTLKDLIHQYHQEELRLIQQPRKYLDELFNSPVNTNLIFVKPPPFLSRRTVKQPQALTEYRFDSPKSLSKKTPLSPSSTPNSSPSAHLRSAKRIQESREKIRLHTEKQVCVCNKLTIIDPYNSEQDQGDLPSNGYIFPPVRAFGYFRRKTIEASPLLNKRKSVRKKQLLKTTPSSTDMNKSLTPLTDFDDDITNPPNTTVNMSLK